MTEESAQKVVTLTEDSAQKVPILEESAQFNEESGEKDEQTPLKE